MDKLKMEARPMDEVLQKVAAICPAAVQGDKIDFERLKQELEPQLDDSAESYNFTWVGKRDAIIGATLPVRKTLRPCKEESKNWDTTKNLYIEGDNLDVLKLLQESYLGKVKCIYLDPPYNTGNDFVYCDDFADSCKEYLEKKGQCDLETHERLFKNDESKGRFHSNWCTMIYPRLKVARDLLSDDGVIFISIDNHEQANLRKICDEVFGENNFIESIIWQKKFSPQNDATYFSTMHDFILCYAKKKKENKADTGWNRILLPRTEMPDGYKNPDNDPRGPWSSGDFTAEGPTPNCIYEIEAPSGKKWLPPVGKRWVYNQDNFKTLLAENRFWFGKDGNAFPRIKRYWSEVQQGMVPNSMWFFEEVGHTQEGKQETNALFDRAVFDYPKPVRLLKRILQISTTKEDIVLDFFSGSSTSAHAVMQLNAEDGGHRKFIMVQLPELCDEKSEAFKAGYKNICEIGKERIRRAGDKIVSETGKKDLDIGFKVLKLDDSNMENVYYNPAETAQGNLLAKVDNIKKDRTELDLLYGVMLDLGLQLDLDVSEVTSGKTTYYNVDNGSLVACFAQNIPESIIKEIANLKPFRVVFKDSSFADAPSKINVTEIFKTLSPNTKITVL